MRPETDPIGDLRFNEAFGFTRISGHRVTLGQLADPIRDREATGITLGYGHEGIAQPVTHRDAAIPLTNVGPC
ncbi:hypothetical protein GCM10020258_52220 [Sphingomonas yabuuchiae]